MEKRVGYVIRCNKGMFMRGMPSYCQWEAEFSKARIYSTSRGASKALRHMSERYVGVARGAAVVPVHITLEA